MRWETDGESVFHTSTGGSQPFNTNKAIKMNIKRAPYGRGECSRDPRLDVYTETEIQDDLPSEPFFFCDEVTVNENIGSHHYLKHQGLNRGFRQ
jgi:hypothetical protein